MVLAVQPENEYVALLLDYTYGLLLEDVQSQVIEHEQSTLLKEFVASLRGE